MKKDVPIVDADNKAFVSKENLPLPFVHYPGLVGPFIGFSEEENSDIFFCSCFKKTFDNYFYTREKSYSVRYDRMYDYILPSNRFPYDFVKKLLQENIPSTKDAVSKRICFKDNICHQCNAISPCYRVNCCSMSTFELGHAWYLKKFEIDLGLEISTDSVPPEYLEVLKSVHDLSDKGQLAAQAGNYSEASVYYNASSRKWTIFHRWMENEVRSAFHYPLIGERWIEETNLYKIIQEILPDYKLMKNYRPDWLDRLELDIFVPDIPLGIEYQGIQHYHPIKHWGGEEGLKKRKEHDERKFILAQKNNIPIVYFTYKDIITSELVYERIQAYLNAKAVTNRR